MERKEKNAVIESLRHEQANAVKLYLQYKGYHWNVAGPLFHDLHLMFDENAKHLVDTIDELAERQRILGVPAEYTLEQFRLSATLDVPSKVPVNPKEMVERLVASHRLVLQELKNGVDLADKDGDPGTVDLFTRLVTVHEKMEWFLRELLESTSPVLEGRSVSPSYGTPMPVTAGR